MVAASDSGTVDAVGTASLSSMASVWWCGWIVVWFSVRDRSRARMLVQARESALLALCRKGRTGSRSAQRVENEAVRLWALPLLY